MLQFIIFLGAVINVIGTFSYIRETIRGNTKPNKVTWLLWSIAPLIAAAASFSDGVRPLVIVPVLFSGLMPLLVLLSSFVNPNAYWKLEKFDYLCGIFSLLALILWQLTDEPAVAIFLAIVSDIFASIPTIVKSWRFPKTETPLAYLTASLSTLTAFFAITTWDFSSYAFPLYLVLLNTLLVIILYRKKFIP